QRDGARTPMPWSADGPLCGFSTREPWLPLGDEHRSLAVAIQDDVPDSILNLFRKIMQLRSSSPALLRGSIEFLPSPPDTLLLVRRTAGGAAAWCSINFTNHPVAMSLPIEMAAPADVIVGSLRCEDGALLIEPFSGAIKAS
ncbi:MAG: alpha-glucosidase, partial [Brevundimonas sp.]|nr:alpha-glucosidase [Brevundimonas sp.]